MLDPICRTVLWKRRVEEMAIEGRDMKSIHHGRGSRANVFNYLEKKALGGFERSLNEFRDLGQF